MEATPIRTAAYTPLPATPRPTEAGSPPAAATDLPPEKSVQPSSETTAPRPAAENDFAKAESNIKREEYRDKITASIVFRAVDMDTGEVVQQIPEESILRLRRAFAETTQKDMTGLAFSRSL